MEDAAREGPDVEAEAPTPPPTAELVAAALPEAELSLEAAAAWLSLADAATAFPGTATD